MRPSFSFPFVKPPNMTPASDNSLLEEFAPFAIKCRPEAPWIKRCGNAIKFTDEIQDDTKVQLATEGTFQYTF